MGKNALKRERQAAHREDATANQLHQEDTQLPAPKEYRQKSHEASHPQCNMDNPEHAEMLASPSIRET